MRGVSNNAWSNAMKKEEDAASALHGYLLTEEEHQHLKLLCENLLLMAEFVTATTEEEEGELLRIKRSRLGWMFESVAFQLEQVLLKVHRTGRHLQTPRQKH
jgi:hypothetical protein